MFVKLYVITEKGRDFLAVYLSTKERLMESVLELLEQRPITEISVGDIAENAGLSSRTFYNHFQDKHELVGYSYRKTVEPLWYTDGKRNSLKEFFHRCLSRNQNQHLMSFRNALCYCGQNDLRSEIEAKGVEDLIRLLQWNSYPGEITEDLRHTLLFFMCGISRMCELHFQDPRSLPVDWLYTFWMQCLPTDLSEYLTKEPEGVQ